MTGNCQLIAVVAGEVVVSAEPPIGYVTLLITDIERSTGLWERAGDQFAAQLAEHDAILRQAAEAAGGYEVKHTGDGLIVAFGNPSEALRCALRAQTDLACHQWPAEIGPIRSRMGVHSGEAIVAIAREGRADFLGPTVNRAARVAQTGHGGQVLVSSAAREEASDDLPPGARLIDLGSYRLRGLSDQERIFQLVHPDLPQNEFPALRTLDAHPHNLPVALSSFVGRETEIAELLSLLSDPDVRLATLLGPGGTGKTRLALEVAASAVDTFPDGVWFVDLAQLTSPEEVGPAVADALRLTVDPQHDVADQLLAFIQDKTMLLVLDNFEQVLAAALFVRQLLQLAPHVTALVTSRIMLRLGGEQAFEVAPLPVPDESAPLHEIVRCDSVVLFAARARAVRRDFQITEQTAPTIARICARVAGIPLGVELAASRLRALTAEEVLRQLSRGIGILLARRPDLPARHQTMRRAIQWSYDLLTPPQQQLFAQVAVFAGSLTLEAAERVCDPPAFIEDILDLCDHSLLVPCPHGDITRYSLLQPLQEFARELPDAAASAALARRHAEYFLELLSDRSALADTPQEPMAFDEIAGDLDNIRAAMGWAEEVGEHWVCAQFARKLFEFLWRRGLWDERLARTEQGLAAARQLFPPDQQLTAELEHNLAAALEDAGRAEEARQTATRACERARACGDHDAVARCTNLLGRLALEAGRLNDAGAAFTEALQTWEAAGNEAGRVLGLHNLALVAHLRGEIQQAQRLYEDTLRLRERLGQQRGAAEVLNNLGVIAEDAGDLAEAWRLYRRTLALRRDLRDPLGMAVAINNLGEVAEHQGRYEEAARLVAAALTTFRKLGSRHAEQAQAAIERLEASVGAELVGSVMQQAGTIEQLAAAMLAET